MACNEALNTIQRIGTIEQFLRENSLEGVTDKEMYNFIWEARMTAHAELKFYRNGGTYDMWKKMLEAKKKKR